MKRLKYAVTYTLIVLFNYNCASDDQNSYQELEPLVQVPDHFPSFVDSPTNPLTKDGIALGKRLFYDTSLSKTNTVSCATCHHQNLAFTDGVALGNFGVSGNFLHRNAPTLVNLAWATNGLFWDGGSTNLESQAFAPLAHPDEMFQNLEQLVLELQADPTYNMWFQKAFQQNITQAGIVKALAQFQRTLVSGTSKFDAYQKTGASNLLTALEKEGLALAETHCFSCHTSPLLTDNQYHNNGIDSDFSNTSQEGIYLGRFRVTHNRADLGKYRTPTLRNIALTAPYMHDGRFVSLEEVLAHYSSGVSNSETLDPRLKTNGVLGIPLSAQDKIKLIAFLKTLTDYEFINNPKFSEF